MLITTDGRPRAGASPKSVGKWRGGPAEWLALGAILLVGVATGRAIGRGYVPLDDNGVIEARARDVLGGGPLPLVGSVSSASRGGDVVHHPGPLLFDLLSVPVRLLPGGVGVAVGAALINGMAIAAIAIVARRLLGGDGAVVVLAGVAGLIWSMGSEGLFEAWQPIVTMVPFLLALVAAWSWASGNDEHAVVFVVAVSFCMQTHGSYLLLGAGLSAAALAIRVVARRWRRPDRRCLVIAVGAGLLAWLQPLIDLLVGDRNLVGIVARATRGGGEFSALGIGDGIRAAAMVLVKPPWWTRPGMATSSPRGGGLVRTEEGLVFDPPWLSLPIAAVGLVALVALLAAVAMGAQQRRTDRVVFAGGIVGVVAVVAGVITLAALPVDDFGFTAHRARWLWPMGVYLTAFLILALLRSAVLPDRRRAVAALGIVGGLTLGSTLPTSYQWLSPQQFEVAWQDSARELRDLAGEVDGRGVVFLDLAGRPFPDMYNDTLAAELAKRGIEFRVAGEYLVGQYGEQRRLDPDDGADVTVRVLIGDDAVSPPPEFTFVAEVADAPQPLALGIREFVAPTG